MERVFLRQTCLVKAGIQFENMKSIITVVMNDIGVVSRKRLLYRIKKDFIEDYTSETIPQHLIKLLK